MEDLDTFLTLLETVHFRVLGFTDPAVITFYESFTEYLMRNMKKRIYQHPKMNGLGVMLTMMYSPQSSWLTVRLNLDAISKCWEAEGHERGPEHRDRTYG